MADVRLDPINCLSVERIELTLHKDGTPWTGIDSCDFVFEHADGTHSVWAATLKTPDAGTWYYVTTATDIPAADKGLRNIGVRPVDGSITKRNPYKVTIMVTDNP